MYYMLYVLNLLDTIQPLYWGHVTHIYMYTCRHYLLKPNVAGHKGVV